MRGIAQNQNFIECYDVDIIEITNFHVNHLEIMSGNILRISKIGYFYIRDIFLSYCVFFNANLLVLQGNYYTFIEKLGLINNSMKFSSIFSLETINDINQMMMFSDISLLNNEFENYSNLFKFVMRSSNQIIYIKNLEIMQNVFSNSIFDCIFTVALSSQMLFENISLINNIISISILNISAFDENTPLKIFLVNFFVKLTNDNFAINFFQQTQNYFIFAGNSELEISLFSFIQNKCVIGPCAFSFLSENSKFLINIANSYFFNNTVYFESGSNDNIPICLVSLEGELNISFYNILIKNNTIYDYISKEIGIVFIISKDNNLGSLLIQNIWFMNNSGNAIIDFKGYYLNIINATFDKSVLISNFRTFILTIDCFYANLTNIVFVESVGGILFLNSQKENILLWILNITIFENIANFSSFMSLTMKYRIDIINLKYFSNFCFGHSMFLLIYTFESDSENHLFFINESLFLNNTALDTDIGLFEVRAIGIYLIFSNCLFVKNVVKGVLSQGSIIYSNGETTLFTFFYDCNFSYNSAAYGGVMYALLSSFILNNCIFEENSVQLIEGT